MSITLLGFGEPALELLRLIPQQPSQPGCLALCPSPLLTSSTPIRCPRGEGIYPLHSAAPYAPYAHSGRQRPPGA